MGILFPSTFTWIKLASYTGRWASFEHIHHLFLSTPTTSTLILAHIISLFKQLKVLLRWNSPIWIVHNTMVFRIFIEFYIHRLYIHRASQFNFRMFSSLLKETPYRGKSSPICPLLKTWIPLIYFLSLWICLFWTFHINGIV